MTSKNSRNWLVAFSFMIAAWASSALADDYTDVAKLVKNGQYQEAMVKVDAYLALHPKDANMRFTKGLIFAEQNRTNDAIVIFTKLTEDYPELPEPYNNLAVLYASINQFDKARAALEMAIRTNPSYSTAHENLGDVYARMASQAYDKALQLDSGNSGAKLKLNLIHNLFNNSNSSINSNVATNVKTPAPTVATAKPVTPAAKPVNEVTPPLATTKPAPVKTEPAKPAVVAKAEPAKVEPAKATPANSGDQDDVLKTVNGWASAWSDKNTSAYLAYYGNDFQTPKGESRKAWSDERKLRIEGKGHISVKIESPKVAVDGNTATVKFRQIYSSDQLKADSRKTLVLTKQDGKWQISQERSGG
jgi:tetratricopeptide (TPR) repeat protein